MNILIYPLWVILGVGLALLFIRTQSWSVALINPQYPKFSKRIIIGGAIIRWLIIASVLILTLSHSIVSMLILFFAFMITRFLVFMRSEGILA